jgi:metal-responsive CopG/Arc/MetJ family transcriptional regulator
MVNLPDKLYQQADKTAQILGLDCKQLFVIAIEQYVRSYSAKNLAESDETKYISDLSNAQLSSMDKIWNTKEEDEIWAIL